MCSTTCYLLQGCTSNLNVKVDAISGSMEAQDLESSAVSPAARRNGTPILEEDLADAKNM